MKAFAVFTTEYNSKLPYSTVAILAAGLTLLAALFLPCAVTFGGPLAMDIDRQMTDLSQQLNLSDKQVEQVRPICEETIQEIRKMMWQMLIQVPGGRQAMCDKIAELMKGTEEQMSAILTAIQMNTYRQMVAEKLQKMQNQKAHGE